MSAPSSLLSLQGVTACYGNINALHDVSIEVPAGEIVTLIGANGAGKSTLMMTIFGNPRAHLGRVLFDGRDITQLPTHEIARLGMSLSPEGRRIFGRMTVEENLRMAPSSLGATTTIASWRTSPPSSPASRSVCTSAAARCRVASSRCWPSRAPS